MKGLNIVKARGRWYVYHRATGKALLRKFDGSKADLYRHMGHPDFLDTFARATRKAETRVVAGSIGELVEWYKTTPSWEAKKARTKEDYDRIFKYLRDSNAASFPLSEIDRPAIVVLRDRAHVALKPKWGAYTISVLSAVFKQAVQYGKMAENPAIGVEKLYRANKNANRRWTEEELNAVFGALPPHLLPVLALARWAGMRGQDICDARRTIYRADLIYGKAITYTTKKSNKEVWIPVEAPLQNVLDNLPHDALTLVANTRGVPYVSDNAMRKAWGDWKATANIGIAISGLTLHGLRVTFASEWRDRGADERTIADLLGDESSAMGAHYSRGADRRSNVAKLFKQNQS